VRAQLYEISDCPHGRLAIVARPRAGDWLPDEAMSWHLQGLSVIISLLQDSEVAELGLESEAAECARAGLAFVRFPIPDRGLPESEASVSRLVSDVIARLRTNLSVGIHCRIGVGRSAMIATCVLAALGLPLELAWSAVGKARGLSVPDTQSQRAWVGTWLVGYKSSCEVVA
jgi:protein-tyrosine phosphatase